MTNLRHASGTSDEKSSSAVTMCGSINAAVVVGALTVSTCTVISCCGGIRHFLVRYTGTGTILVSNATTEY